MSDIKNHRINLLFLLLIALSAYSQPEQRNGNDSSDLRFLKGETLQFRLSYGWFTVGRAKLVVDPDFHVYENEQCYKIDITGHTAGFIGLFARVNDMWGAYVSKETMLPKMAYADIQEGNYTRQEKIYFDQDTGDIKVEMTKKKRKRPTKYYDFGPEIHDLISGYMLLRNMDFSKLAAGDTIRFKAFYDEIFYDMKVVFEGTEIIKTKVGRLTAYRVVPLIPENKIFPGKKPITGWVSADANQLPLRVSANMFFGTAYCDLTGYKNIKFGPDFE